MILDAHIHLGHDVVFDHGNDEETLLKFYEKYGVDGGLVQPGLPRPYIEDTRAIHDRIHRFTKNGRGRWWGLAVINPHFRPEEYDAEAERCVRELGFVGIKLHPLGQGCHPSSESGLRVFEVCRRLGVPVMIHTGNGVPFADPMACAEAVERFPDVRVVLAHAGSEMHHSQALYLAKKHENVYLEPSWVGVAGVGRMLRVVGANKIMFSSDLVHQIPVELAKYRSLIDDAAGLERVLCGTVTEVFGLKV